MFNGEHYLGSQNRRLCPHVVSRSTYPSPSTNDVDAHIVFHLQCLCRYKCPFFNLCGVGRFSLPSDVGPRLRSDGGRCHLDLAGGPCHRQGDPLPPVVTEPTTAVDPPDTHRPPSTTIPQDVTTRQHAYRVLTVGRADALPQRSSS